MAFSSSGRSLKRAAAGAAETVLTCWRTAAGTGPLPTAPGTVLHGRYKIVKLLAVGGFGAVYLAKDTKNGEREVAIKDMICADPTEFAIRLNFFRREAEILKSLDKIAIVPRVTDLIEKPAQGEAPSNLAVIGRYVLDSSIFQAIRETQPGRGGEIQLTDALRKVAVAPADEGGGIHGVVFRGRRYDTGDRLDYLKAVVRLALERDDLGPHPAQGRIDQFAPAPLGDALAHRVRQVERHEETGTRDFRSLLAHRIHATPCERTS